ncbi:MAG: transposase [Oscillatoria sp. SIO1A7]|nr:transposase [Oscillatoria sp. SIO1A7]
MDFHLAHLLSFPNTTVETCQYCDNSVVIKITLLNTGIYCPHCDRFTEDINQDRPILVRDLPAFGKKVYLEVPRRQFFCSNCQKFFTENLDYIHAKRRHTIRYEQYVYERVIASNIGLGREESLKYDEIKAMFDARAKNEKKNDWSRVERINIDEFSVRKGHKNFQTVIGDPDNQCLLDVIDGHTQQKVTEALMEQPLLDSRTGKRSQCRYVGRVSKSN